MDTSGETQTGDVTRNILDLDPLSIDHILQNILSHLHDPQDILQCRLVNRTWHSIATKLFLKESKKTLVLHYENDSFKRFVENIENSWLIPFNDIEVYGEHEENSPFVDTPHTLLKLLGKCGHSLTRFKVIQKMEFCAEGWQQRVCEMIEMEPLDYPVLMQTMDLSNLETLDMAVCFVTYGAEDEGEALYDQLMEMWVNFFRILLRKSLKLKELRVMVGNHRNIYQDLPIPVGNLEKGILLEIISSIPQWKISGLKRLTIHMHTDKSLQPHLQSLKDTLVHENLSLVAFGLLQPGDLYDSYFEDLGVHAISVSLLCTQKESLEELYTDWTFENIGSVPVCGKLNKLECKASRNHDFLKFGKLFPLLQYLKVCFVDFEQPSEPLQHSWDPLNFVTAPSCAILFPNLKRLELTGYLEAPWDLLRIVFAKMTSLEELYLSLVEKSSSFGKELAPAYDSLFTGIPRTVCKEMLDKENYQPDLSDVEGERVPGMLNLRNLKELNLGYGGCPSDVTGYLVFLALPKEVKIHAVCTMMTKQCINLLEERFQDFDVGQKTLRVPNFYAT